MDTFVTQNQKWHIKQMPESHCRKRMQVHVRCLTKDEERSCVCDSKSKMTQCCPVRKNAHKR